ncbi:Hypothetical predicted protein, partial [Mytilus galloprovincialis]
MAKEKETAGYDAGPRLIPIPISIHTTRGSIKSSPGKQDTTLDTPTKRTIQRKDGREGRKYKAKHTKGLGDSEQIPEDYWHYNYNGFKDSEKFKTQMISKTESTDRSKSKGDSP